MYFGFSRPLQFNNGTLYVSKDFFALFSLLFFCGIFSFNSLFYASEGSSYKLLPASFINPILSLIQHGIFALTCFFLLRNISGTLKVLLDRKIHCVFIILLSISFVWSVTPDYTFDKSLALIETIIFGLFLATFIPIHKQLRILRIVLLTAAILSILVAVALPASGVESGIHSGAWRGIFIHKNYLARNMVLAGAVSQLISSNKPWDREMSNLLFLLSLILVILSTSKTGLLAYLSVILVTKLLKTLRLKLDILIFTWIPLILITASLIYYIGSNYESILVSLDRSPTLSGRTIIWSTLISKINERFWLGYGYLGFWHGIYGESAIIGKVITDYIPPHAHNGFLDLALYFGFMGFSTFITSLFSLTRKAVILARNTTVMEGIWPLTYIFFLLIYNFTESSLIEHNLLYTILLISLLFSPLKRVFVYEKNLNSGHQAATNQLI